MDRQEAAKQLETADTLQNRMRQNARHCAVAAIVLGATTLLGTLALGAVSGNFVQTLPLTLVIYGAAVFGGIYAWTRPTLPRHYLAMHLTMCVGGIAVVHTITVTVGRVLFPGEWLWWGPGALLAAAPAFVVAFLTWRRSGAPHR